MAQISYGTITITDTNDIERIYTVYAKSTTNTNVPSAEASDWEESISDAPGTGNYIWQRTVVEKSGTSEKTYSDPVCLTGEEGDEGRGIVSITIKYGISADWNTQPSNWYDNTPEYSSSTPKYWTQTTINYTSGNPTVKVTQDKALTQAIYDSVIASSIAQNANENANGALSIATGVEQHFFWIGNDYNTNIPAGAYVAEKAKDEFKTNPTGGNLITRTDGIYIRNGINLLSALTGTALEFYNPSTNTKTIELGTISNTPSLLFYNPTNSTIPMMSLQSAGLTFYTSAGGEIGTFGSNGLDMSGSLNIKGGGRIGQDSSNYWEFGDNRSYKDTDSAYLMGIGNASIQLGQNGHWRLDNNRIHTGWYQLNDSTRGLLHFDTAEDTVNNVTNT